jgi:hypothetical protein
MHKKFRVLCIDNKHIALPIFQEYQEYWATENPKDDQTYLIDGRPWRKDRFCKMEEEVEVEENKMVQYA